MNKIFYDKKKDVFQVFVPFSLLPFSHIWNPKNDKEITKEHLKLFLEEGFLYNFRRSGPYSASSPYTKNNNAFISDFVYIYSGTLFMYLSEKEKIFYKDCDYFLQYFIDSSAVYKLFSHLISEEKFPLLLDEQFKKVFGSKAYITFENLEFFTFISSKEKLLSLEKELDIFEIEDEELFFKYLDESVADLEGAKKISYNPSSSEKLSTSFEELDKYLN